MSQKENKSNNGPYEYTGIVHVIGDKVSFPSGFTKQQMVVCNDSGKFPSYAAFDFIKGTSQTAKDFTKELHGVKKGDEVTVSFFVDAMEAKKTPGSWFPTLRAYKLTKVATSAVVNLLPPTPPAQQNDGVDDIDDMPF